MSAAHAPHSLAVYVDLAAARDLVVDDLPGAPASKARASAPTATAISLPAHSSSRSPPGIRPTASTSPASPADAREEDG